MYKQTAVGHDGKVFIVTHLAHVTRGDIVISNVTMSCTLNRGLVLRTRDNSWYVFRTDYGDLKDKDTIRHVEEYL